MASPASQNRTGALVIAGVVVPLLVLAAAIGFTQYQLRDILRAQIARRDATLLDGLLRQQLRESGDETAADPLSAVLETTRLPQLPGVRSVIVYSPSGSFVHAWPLTAATVALDPALRLEAERDRSSARFHPERMLSDEFLTARDSDSRTESLLEILVAVPDPLNTGVAGFARFLLDGSGMAREYDRLDQSLRRQAAIAFGLAGLATAGVLGLAFRKLNRANERLRRANQELTLAAKTSAMGAVASHLIHGLKNPLAGLQTLLRDPALGSDPTGGLNDATQLARRMRLMIDDVARVLREDSGFAGYEVEAADVFSVLMQRVQPGATTRGQRIESRFELPLILSNRDANLTLLILENLVHNALQASSDQSVLTVALTGDRESAVFSVIDRAGGLPEHVRERLFTPVISTKPGGTGIGLALSRQLARHMGADLRLVRTGPEGTEFALILPLPRPANG
jgi:signal transduction histidine kinase